MDVLVTGAKGMLGTDLVQELETRRHNVTAVDLEELDITDPVAAAGLATGEYGHFDWCVNCAAYTAVDKAEEDFDHAMLVNGIAPGYLARACSMAQARILHVSTDFVFDGETAEPYSEEAQTNPLSVYGRSKLEGENAVFANTGDAVIVRTAWLYGPNGSSFPKTLIKAWLSGKNLRVVSDQVGSPTYTTDLSRVLTDIIEINPAGGVYHATGPDIMTWHGFAKTAIEVYQEVALAQRASVEIESILTSDWPTPAKRPKYSALSFGKLAALGVQSMRPVDEALADFAERLPSSLVRTEDIHSRKGSTFKTPPI